MDDLPYLLTARDIEAFPGTEKTHYLNEMAQRTNKSLGDLTGLQGFGIHLIEVPPGHLTTEHHVHYFEDECIYVLEGTATAFIGEDKHAIGPGDFIGYRKGGLAHSIENTGDSPLKCIVVGERLAHDVADYPKLEKRLYRNKGQQAALVALDDIQHPKLGGK